jgi:glutamate synthase (NADPH/NADH) small chain
MRTSSSHEEGCQRQWSVMTKKFSGVETRVTQLHCCKVEWIPAPASPDARRGGGRKNGNWKLKELPGTDFIRDADVVLLAMGFLHVTHNGLVKELGLDLDESGNLAVENCQTNEPSVFAAGDTINGASLVVRAINSGREAAAAIDDWLKKQS